MPQHDHDFPLGPDGPTSCTCQMSYADWAHMTRLGRDVSWTSATDDDTRAVRDALHPDQVRSTAYTYTLNSRPRQSVYAWLAEFERTAGMSWQDAWRVAHAVEAALEHSYAGRVFLVTDEASGEHVATRLIYSDNDADVPVTVWDEDNDPQELIAQAAGHITPCPTPDLADGDDSCEHGAWPCEVTVLAWRLRGLDPDEVVEDTLNQIRREFAAMQGADGYVRDGA